MPTPNSNPPPKFSLEDLLRLKRHERPEPGFWVRFDRELQERVWRSLLDPVPVEKGGVRGFFARRVTWLASGAAAALVIGLVWQSNFSVLHHQPFNIPIFTASNLVPAKTNIENVPSPASAPAPVAAVNADNSFPSAQPTSVVASLTDDSRSTNYQKVAASVAFAADRADGVRYAADTLGETAYAVGMRGSAF